VASRKPCLARLTSDKIPRQLFALTRQVIENPPAGSPVSRKVLLRRVGAIILFIVHPTQPLDPSNPRTKPTKEVSGGGIRPAYWYIDLKKSGRVGRGQPPTTILGRKRKADVVIECSTYAGLKLKLVAVLLTILCRGFGSRQHRSRPGVC
jgi:hypothetical protein